MKPSYRNMLAAMAFVVALLPGTPAAAEKTQSKAVTLFTMEDKKFHGGFSVGWVAKEWRTSHDGQTLREDLWGNPGKMLHGVQFGLHANQSIYYGLGWRTGFYYEWYISHDGFLKENGWDRFNEHSLYIPIHIQMRLPVTRKISISPYAGIGFNLVMKGRMKNGPMTDASGKEVINNGNNHVNSTPLLLDLIGDLITSATARKEYIQHEVQGYVYDNHTPRKFNLQAELGVALRIYAAQLTFTYSWGLTDHHLYDFASSRQNKLAVNLGITF
ncbi:MAG: hypothetical protein IJR87_13525 [Bacteroidaceae bacterium]|nr:hypothetical protein [Bacteroidaceae bacterium]